jgi:5,5'-dehydrodivanillate O-demethylase
MLSTDENKRLTEVGRGTPMGDLLRRYWHPVAPAAELTNRPTKQLRLLGEDLVLYKDKRGTYGLLGLHCPHRRANLVYGLVENTGLRCSYHGWCFDETGACIEQPFEDTVRSVNAYREKTPAQAYAVREKAGLLWAYLGPDPAPCLWDWDAYNARGFKYVSIAHVPCNWLQCQENSVDSVHFEWLHQNWSLHRAGKPYGPQHRRLAFDEHEFGITYRRILSNTDEEDELWQTGRMCLWPNCLFVGNSFNWNVPVDDETTLRVCWWVHPLRGTLPYEQSQIPYWYAPIKDTNGGWIVDGGSHQDIVAMVGQGTIADRSREHLGQSDRGIVLLRRIFANDLIRIAAGDDPKGVLRDESRNQRIALPYVRAELAAPDAILPIARIGMSGPPQEIADELERTWLAHSDDA